MTTGASVTALQRGAIVPRRNALATAEARASAVTFFARPGGNHLLALLKQTIRSRVSLQTHNKHPEITANQQIVS
jgi:hypothetical protein